MDATPLMGLLADMAKAQQAEVMALRQTNAASSPVTKRFVQPVGPASAVNRGHYENARMSSNRIIF